MSGPRPPCVQVAHAFRAREQGFSFVEVMVALSMLLVGCLAILPLFALGVQNLAQRRLTTDVRRVRPEVQVLVQEEVDRAGGRPPRDLDASRKKPYPLSLPGYDVLIEWLESPFDGAGVWALAAIRRQGEVVHVLPPLAVRRSTFDPEGLSAPQPPSRR